MIAFRAKFPTTNTLVASNGMSRRERRRKLRKLLAGKEQACFIVNTNITLAEAKEELQNRVNVCSHFITLSLSFSCHDINKNFFNVQEPGLWVVLSNSNVT